MLAFFPVDTRRNPPETFIAIVAIAVLLDFVWKRYRGPHAGTTPPDPGGEQGAVSVPA